MTNNEYLALEQAAQDARDKRDLAREELREYLKPEPRGPWAATGEPETWELLPV